MPTRNISLTKAQDEFVETIVESGEYQNASEAIRDALRALQKRRKEDALRLRALRAMIDEGLTALNRGDIVELDDSELDGFMKSLTPARRKRSR